MTFIEFEHAYDNGVPVFVVAELIGAVRTLSIPGKSLLTFAAGGDIYVKGEPAEVMAKLRGER